MLRQSILRRVCGGLMVVTLLTAPLTAAFRDRLPVSKSDDVLRRPRKSSAAAHPVPAGKPVLNGAPTAHSQSSGSAPARGAAPQPARHAVVEPIDFGLLVRLIHAEAGGESLRGQVAVGAVILNRIHSGRFPKTIKGNVFKDGEFESVSNGYIWSNPTAASYRAARLAIRGFDPTHGALYFYNPAKTYSVWIWSRPIIAKIGRHFFAS